ncbi:hypothetical protein ACERIT_12295 [Halopenitus sp. H-Gu1]|uniref:hypothetical protein n=1 Tax=Halopenitus sp. H-Gu1 TaxID=3242697 RepID=UPI00359D42D0
MPECYKDASWLREQYHDRGKSLSKIAEESDRHLTTIKYWMEKHEIDRRAAKPPSTDSDVADAEWLRQKYLEEGLSTREIAEEADVHSTTVLKYLNKHGIETRPKERHRSTQMSVSVKRDGYEVIQHREPDGTVSKVFIHRLASVAWFGLDAVADNVIHHADPEDHGRPGVPWDNRESVLQPMSAQEHGRLHNHENG